MDVVFVVGVTVSPIYRSDDVDHFSSEYPLFVTRSANQAIWRAIDLENGFKPVVDRWERDYVGITVMERQPGDALYRPSELCRVPGIISHHIGVHGLNNYDFIPQNESEDENDLWCVGLIGDMQYFIGCHLYLAEDAKTARELYNNLERQTPHIYSWCKQRVSTDGGVVWWKN
jgi:hypothetical protein